LSFALSVAPSLGPLPCFSAAKRVKAVFLRLKIDLVYISARLLNPIYGVLRNRRHKIMGSIFLCKEKSVDNLCVALPRALIACG